MENQTNAQNQRVPVIQVSGLKKQYKLGQIDLEKLYPGTISACAQKHKLQQSRCPANGTGFLRGGTIK